MPHVRFSLTVQNPVKCGEAAGPGNQLEKSGAYNYEVWKASRVLEFLILIFWISMWSLMVIPHLSKCYHRLLPNVGSLGLTPLFLVIGGYFKKNINPCRHPLPQIYLNLNELNSTFEVYVSQVTSCSLHEIVIIQTRAEQHVWMTLQAGSWQSKIEDICLCAVRI
jgi:hypothetical protein